VRKLVSLFILSFLVFCASGQETSEKKVMIGIKGGSSVSQMRFYPSVNQSILSGYTGGIVVKVMSQKHVGIQTEINYTQKGWKEKVSEEFRYSRRLNYLDVPFMTHVSIGKRRFGIFFNIGPSLSVLLSEDESIEPGTTSLSELANGDSYYGEPIDNIIDFQFTAGLGARYEFKGGNAFEVEGRAYGSLPNVFDPDKYVYSASQNQLATVTMSYLFSLSK